MLSLPNTKLNIFTKITPEAVAMMNDNAPSAKIKIESMVRNSEACVEAPTANPYNAAKYGYIDDVIEPRNTRFRIIRALQQLQTKKLTNPAKKHGNIPL